MEQKIKSAWDEWEIVEHLGGGSYGEVYKAVKRDFGAEMFSAIKIINIPKSQSELKSLCANGMNAEQSKTYLEGIVNSLIHEIKLMVSLNSAPNIVTIYDYKVLEKPGEIGWDIYIRMELLTGFDDYLNNIDLADETIVKIGKDICSALEVCEKQNPPIIHRDIKPGNIFATGLGDFKLGDFGEARELEKSSYLHSTKGTPNYMAPEVKRGDAYGNTADIYSLGMVLYKLANKNRLPFCDPGKQMLRQSDYEEAFIRRCKGEPIPPPSGAGERLAKAILKAVEFDPKKRYKSASEFKSALEAPTHVSIFEKLAIFFRNNKKQILVFASVLILALAAGYFGMNAFNFEVAAFSLELEPQHIILSLQQTGSLTVKQIMANGDTIIMNPANVAWSSADENIAKIDINSVTGLNLGKTTIEGRYKDQIVNLTVNVVEPMDGMVDIVQRYELGHKVTLFGGGENCEHTDGAISGEAEFVSPGSIAMTEDKTVYLADSGILRKIEDGIVEKIKIDPFYMTPDIVRCHKNEVYIATNEWQETDGGMNYGIIRLKDGNRAETIYTADAHYSEITDFGISPQNENLLYFIERNAGTDETNLKTINLQNFGDIYTVRTLPQGTRSFAFGEDNEIYFANPEMGIIQSFKNGDFRYLAGKENEKAFIDGNAPLFYMPQKIKYANGFLYIWDFNVLRKISIENGIVADCMSVAGEASSDFDLALEKECNAEDAIFANSKFCDFLVLDDGIVLTDPKRGVIWKLE